MKGRSVTEPNKERHPVTRWLARQTRYLHVWRLKNGRTVYEQVLRGAAYGVGSGAVSLIVLCIESRF